MHKNSVNFTPKTNNAANEDVSNEDVTKKPETKEEVDTKTPETKEEVNKLKITSMTDGQLETNKSYHVIEGTAPTGSSSIKINDYVLKKYSPGEKKWSYIASTDYGTLSNGENKFTVIAYDAKGEEIDSTDFTIIYNPAEIPNLPETGSNTLLIMIMSLISSLVFFQVTSKKSIKQYK